MCYVDGLSRPVNLHLSHSWGGGLSRWVSDFVETDPFSDNLVLESLGTINCWGIGYRLVRGADREVLREGTYRVPISETALRHAEHRALLTEICERYGVGHVYQSSFVGHSLEVFGLGLPMTLVLHDYHPLCPAIFLHFGEICDSCPGSRLARCLVENPVDFANGKSSPSYWLEVREAMLEDLSRASVQLVAPSAAARRHWRSLDTRLERLDVRVIPHGIRFGKRNCFGGADGDRKLRVGLLNSLSLVKGLRSIEALFETARLVVDFVFLGTGRQGRPFASRWASELVERYAHHELPDLLERHRLDLFLLPSVFPETYCYTLSETWVHGIPPLARRIGSIPERVRDGEDGFLFDDDDEVLDNLLRFDRERELLRRVADGARRRPVRTVEEMVADYYVLRPDRDAAVERRLETPGHDPDLYLGGA